MKPGRHLRHALERQSSRGGQIGCTLLLGVVLGAVGALAFSVARSDETAPFWVYIVAGVFAFFALLLLYAGVHQLFALRTPQTIIETDSEVFRRGAPVRLHFRQAGPASFESLRANLVGEESWWTGSGNKRRRHVEQLGTFNLFDSGAFEIDAVTPFERTVDVNVPDLPHASAGHEEDWQLEVWGKVRGRADFQHVFPVRVE